MGEPAIGPQERQLRTHLPKDYVVAPLSEVNPEIGRCSSGSYTARGIRWR
jgi:hypothetical protein